MVAQAGSVLDNAGNRPAVEMLEARLAHTTAYEGCVAAYMLLGPVHVRREVHLDPRWTTRIVRPYLVDAAFARRYSPSISSSWAMARSRVGEVCCLRGLLVCVSQLLQPPGLLHLAAGCLILELLRRLLRWLVIHVSSFVQPPGCRQCRLTPTLSRKSGQTRSKGADRPYREEAGGEQAHDMQIRTLVSPSVVKAEVTEPLVALARRMRAHGISALPVYEGDRLVGIVSERDVVSAVADGTATTIVAAECMTPGPVTAAPHEDSADVALRMLELGIRHMPVVEDDRVIGVVSARDLLMLEAWPGRTPPVAPGASQ